METVEFAAGRGTGLASLSDDGPEKPGGVDGRLIPVDALDTPVDCGSNTFAVSRGRTTDGFDDIAPARAQKCVGGWQVTVSQYEACGEQADPTSE
jgi:hypothetical protein